MEDVLDKLRKIKELADRGEQGEAEAARTLLLALLDKYGLTLSDIALQTKRWFPFKATQDELQLLTQCAMKCTDTANLSFRQNKRKRLVFLELTHIAYVSISEEYAHYRKQWKLMIAAHARELESKKDAFYIKHELFPETEGEVTPRTPEEIAELLNAMRRLKTETFKPRSRALEPANGRLLNG